MSHNMEWWDIYVPYDPDRMVCVAVDDYALQNKLRYNNIKICEKCNRSEGRELFLIPGVLMSCPLVEEIDLIEESTLPKDCLHKFEHVVAEGMDGLEQKD